MRTRINPLLASLLAATTITLAACGGDGGDGSTTISAPASGFVLLGDSAAPVDTIGKDGDFFLNSATGQFYGPKTNGAWPASTLTLTGPAGPAGPEGPAGYSAGSVLITGLGVPAVAVGRDGDF